MARARPRRGPAASPEVAGSSWRHDRDRHVDRVAEPARHVLAEPARQALGQRRHDDLVDLAVAQRVAHRHHRVAIADLAVGLGAHLPQAREHLVEAGLGDVAGRLLVPGEPAADRAERHDDVGPHRSVGESRP